MGNSPVYGSSPTSTYFSGVSFNMCDPQHPEVTRLKRCHDTALELLSKALTIDESKTEILDKQEAIKYYQQGLAELEAGVGLRLPVNPSDPSLVRAHRLREKMRGNLATATERLNYLSTAAHLNILSLNQGDSRVPVSRQNTFTKDNRDSSPVKGRSDRGRTAEESTSRGATGGSRGACNSRSPASSSAGKPRINKAAELRLKSNVKVGPAGRGARKVSSKEGLKQANLVIKGCEAKLVEQVLGEMIPKGATGVTFADVAGQEKAKEALREMVVMPILRPDLFTGLRTPAKGLLLFGPPGNGKTLLARALAAEAGSNMINISSSSLVSKWLGEGEKMVRALFGVARHVQPSIIFIDEIDALLSERRSGEHEGVRRIKTEFLLQFEGMLTGPQERVVVVAATNRPQELDDAALRRFTKRVYVEMPDKETRRLLLVSLLEKQGSPLTSKEVDRVVSLTEGYTCSDLTSLARDAALAPVREIPASQLVSIKCQDMRQINLQDFVKSSERVRRSLATDCLKSFQKWNDAFGDIS